MKIARSLKPLESKETPGTIHQKKQKYPILFHRPSPSSLLRLRLRNSLRATHSSDEVHGPHERRARSKGEGDERDVVDRVALLDRDGVLEGHERPAPGGALEGRGAGGGAEEGAGEHCLLGMS